MNKSMFGAIAENRPVSGSAERRLRNDLDTRRSSRFGAAIGRFSIASLDNSAPEYVVHAQYNPKELQVDRTISWAQKDQRDNRPEWLRVKRGREGAGDNHEYTGAPMRSMSFELLFDGYEDNVSIEPDLRRLDELACVRDPDSKKESEGRPHHCVVVYGDQQHNGGLAKLRCVIEKLSIKYTMFSATGVPLRATVNLTVREAFTFAPTKK